VALKAAVMVIVTGIYNSANWIFSPSEAQTTYGSALILKVGLVAVLLGIGALHHIALNPARYARLDAISARVQGFLPTIRLEAVFALIVLMSAALLSATPLPQPDFINQDVNTPTQAQDLGDYTVALSITPGGPGVNTHDVVVTQGGQRVSDVGVTLVNTRPETAYRGSNHLLEAIEDGLYVTATADIDSAGRWWSLLDLTLPDGQAQRLAFEWEIDANAAVIESLEPNLQNYVALMAVVMACLWVVYPLLRRGLEALNLDAVSVTIALVTILFTAIVMIGGYVIVQQTRDSYAQTLRPPAQVINAVLPTQSSLERGADLYTEHCISWQSQPRDFNALRDGLATIRDDDLYSVVTDGWRTLEGCGADLDVSQQWDVVNYLRMLAR
jgi:hypothetical protein